MANGSLARLFWRVFDDLDYWLLTQSRLWLADAVCGPELPAGHGPGWVWVAGHWRSTGGGEAG